MSQPIIQDREEAAHQTEDLLDAQARQRYEEVCAFLDEKLSALTKEVEESERLTKDDFAIRINAH